MSENHELLPLKNENELRHTGDDLIATPALPIQVEPQEEPTPPLQVHHKEDDEIVIEREKNLDE